MPFGEYKDFADCAAKVKKKHPRWSKEHINAYCASIERNITEASKRKHE